MQAPEKIHIPPIIKEVMERITNSGFEVYLVGGSVRDSLLGKAIKDYDMASSALPKELKKIFKGKKILNYGEKHGTITILYKGQMIEITTFREEDDYSDGRRPDSVSFVKDLKTDVSRRDFTVNALAANLDGEVIDYFGGVKDLDNKIIKAVGIPERRFKEDSLRMFRAVRFALRLEAMIDFETKEAILKNIHLLRVHQLATERLQQEMSEIMLYRGYALKMLYELKLLQHIFPEFDSLVKINETINAMNSLDERTDRELEINYATLFFINTPDFAYHTLKGLFSMINGMGNFREDYIIALVQLAQLPEELYNFSNKPALLHYLQKYLGKIQNKKEFNFQHFSDDLIKVSYRVLDPQYIDIIQDKKIFSKLVMLEDLLFYQHPIDGNKVKELGYRGKSISLIMDQWKALIIRNAHGNAEVVSFLLDYETKLRNNNLDLSIEKLRNAISGNDPSNGPIEQELIDLEIRRLKGLYEFHKLPFNVA